VVVFFRRIFRRVGSFAKKAAPVVGRVARVAAPVAGGAAAAMLVRKHSQSQADKAASREIVNTSPLQNEKGDEDKPRI
jgi:uncharacterized membrane-anchored protein